jgi:hypothetical protein
VASVWLLTPGQLLPLPSCHSLLEASWCHHPISFPHSSQLRGLGTLQCSAAPMDMGCLLKTQEHLTLPGPLSSASCPSLSC